MEAPTLEVDFRLCGKSITRMFFSGVLSGTLHNPFMFVGDVDRSWKVDGFDDTVLASCETALGRFRVVGNTKRCILRIPNQQRTSGLRGGWVCVESGTV